MDFPSHAPAVDSGRSPTNASEDAAATARPDTKTQSEAVSKDSSPRSEPPPRVKIRSASHTLLTTFAQPSDKNRKGGKSEAGLTTSNAAVVPAKPPIKRPLSALFSPPLMAVAADTAASVPVVEEHGEVENELPAGAVGPEEAEHSGSTSTSDGKENAGGSSATPSLKSIKQNDESANRLSFSSLFSMGSAIYNGAMGPTSNPGESQASSVAGSLKSNTMEIPASTPNGPVSPSSVSTKADGASSAPSTSSDNVSISGSTHTLVPGDRNGQAPRQSAPPGTSAAARHPETWDTGSLPRLQHNQSTDRRSRSRTQRRPSTSTAASSASPSNGERMKPPSKVPAKGKIGVCALDSKARSKPSRNILTRLQNGGEFEILLFGDKVILDEDVENWPLCDFLISFFSEGFPLDKAIAYVQLRKPFCVNDLPMQKILWDRRLCLKILDKMGVPTPKRIEVNRDGGPILESHNLAEHVFKTNGVKLEGPDTGTGGGTTMTKSVELSEDTDTLLVDGETLRKPFVEKPVSGEDHNIRIYFPKDKDGGGGRKLFRKIGNKSSEWDENLIVPRAITEEGSSYLYEQFLDVDNAEDVKAYTVGPDFCHAETRKSPVVDGLVRRNTHGKEIRYITSLTNEEAVMASRIAEGFGQRICGFDLLRTRSRSFVIDVNGWSFVKDNNEYYDKCASILRQMFLAHKEMRLRQKEKREAASKQPSTAPTSESSVEMSPEAQHHRAPGGHRAALKGLLKSPSVSKLRQHHQQHHHVHGTKSASGSDSPDVSGATTPMTSPPTLERQESKITGIASKSDTLLPDPAISSNAEVNSYGDSVSAEEVHQPEAPPPQAKHSWKLKGMVSVIRHADRTPKQKFKFTFHTEPFVELLKGHQEEVLLKGEAALSSVMEAVKQAMKEGIEDTEKLSLLRTSLMRKGAWTGTKVQIKPMFRKRKPEEMPPKTSNSAEGGEPVAEGDDSQPLRATRSDSLGGATLSRYSARENDLVLDKLQLIIKWGGEPTHAARYQAQDLGENMRNDLLLMNREALGDVSVFTSSERRVSTSAQIWAASFLDQKDLPDTFISVRKDLLDDSNAAKDIMDKVKKKLKLLLREGHEAPPQFAWPANTPEPSVVVRRVAELMRFHRRVMRHNFNKLGNSSAVSLSQKQTSDGSGASSPTSGGKALAQAQAVNQIQARWCCGEDAELFKERWEKLFAEFSDSDKVDPSKISELYDTMKFDALHNRQFLEWVFTPSQSILDEISAVEEKRSEKSVDVISDAGSAEIKRMDKGDRKSSNLSNSSNKESTSLNNGNNSTIAQRMGFRRKSVLNNVSPLPVPEEEETESYFKLFRGGGQSRAKQDVRLENLRELYRYAKILFDFICPQEYGISDIEKLEIGLLTSLPLLREITSDLEEVQAAEHAKTFVYFTKESHIYTLLNAILEGGVKTKIARNAIPELDYLSQINFELYEAEDKESETFAYSIRITLTPGCHTSDPLDLLLDSKHSIGCAPRRSLTAHADWKEVIGTLRDKFHTVKLPKSFLTINLSEKHAWEGKEREADENEDEEGRVKGVGMGPEGGPLGEGSREKGESLAEVVEKESGDVEAVAGEEDFVLAGGK
ncbi:MAG: hypothetical protein MMC23_007837 [Stictis urceolatum]|nr:hypothetical protein [Stictis urceolata]